MMNNDNKISKETKLFGYIGEYASVSRFSVLCNKISKQNSDDMMMIPMNIREDDLYFTLSNMKHSHLKGAVISNEYTDKIVDVLDEKSGLVQRTGMCDIVFRDDKGLRGDLFSTRVLLEKLKDLRAIKIAVIGINPHAKALSLMACGFNLSFFYDNLEKLMGFCDEMGLQNPDINRIADGMSVDFSSFDVVLDFSDMKSFKMVEKFAPYVLDMKNDKEFSALKNRASELQVKYIGYDDMIDEFVSQAYSLMKR